MALISALTARLPNVMKSLSVQPAIQTSFQRLISVSAVDFAARKGTRAKKEKKKVKVEVKKLDFQARRELAKKKAENKHRSLNLHFSDERKAPVPDNLNVYPMTMFKWIQYPITEAVDQFRELYHPTMLNDPNAKIYLHMELNSQGMKKTRFVDPIYRTALLPNGFEVSEERTILIFCKDLELQKKVVEAGATRAGGMEMVKAIQAGELKALEYDYILADFSILTEMIPVRGLLKKKFPSEKHGTVGADVLGLVKKFLNGIQYNSVRDEFQKDFSTIDCPIGTLQMTSKQIEENAIELIKDVDSVRPKKNGPFITKCYIMSPPSNQRVRINPFLYIEEERGGKKHEVEDVDSDDEEETSRVSSRS